MTESCFTVLIASAVLMSFACIVGGFGVLCYTVAKYLGQAEAPESIDLGTGFSLKERSFWLRIQGSKKDPDSKKDHTVSNDDGLLS
ncbi:hypothetical protein [uncultured Selenomonas sp.]|uniref:hypothetical protein n=1 Tax=uncultured Selenomonas sp. TaxID=159275 RepID=UPI0025EFC8A3|nr:hypothetical protein [uncultured Selenomonas sp.]